MDVRHLKYFAEVARFSSFSRAAQSLYISQPAISKMIKTLEDELKVTLFDRSGKQIVLTDAGQAVLKQAQQILTSIENLKNELSDVLDLRTGQITLGLPPMVGSRFFTQAIGKYHQLFPQITMKLVEVGSKNVELGVEYGRLDVGVVTLPVKNESFMVLPFLQEPLMVITSTNHPLANKTVTNICDLIDYALILFHEDFTLHHRVLERCHQCGFLPKIICESSQWDFVAELVAADLGVAVMPQTVCRDLDPLRIRAIPLSDPIYWNLAIIWNKERYMSFATREWLKVSASLFNINLQL